jgi:hypothetical protein
VRLSIKSKQIGGISLIVGLAIVALSAAHLTTLVRIGLEESKARADLLVAAIFQRARTVVPGQPDPYKALREDGGLRTILESSVYTKSVLYAAIVDAQNVAVAHSEPAREGILLAPASALEDVLLLPRGRQLSRVYSPDSLTLEVEQELELGGQKFGAIRVGVSTLLLREELWDAIKPALLTAVIALTLAVFVAGLFTRLMLRPIHVIRGGLTRLGRGELGFRLDMPQQDEFGELGSFFNAVSAQLSADRSQLAGQKASLEAAVEHIEDEVALFNPAGELLFANPGMRRAIPPDSFGRPIDDLLPVGHAYRDLVLSTLRDGQSSGPVSAALPAWRGGDVGPTGGEEGAEGEAKGIERLVMAHAIKDIDQKLLGVMLVARDVEYIGRVQSMLNYSRKLVALGRLSAGVAHEVKNPLNAMTIHLELLKQKLSASGRRVNPVPAVARTAATTGLGLSSATEARPATDLAPALEHVKIIGNEIQRLDQVMQAASPSGGRVRQPAARERRSHDAAAGLPEPRPQRMPGDEGRRFAPGCGFAGLGPKGGGAVRRYGDRDQARASFAHLRPLFHHPGEGQRDRAFDGLQDRAAARRRDRGRIHRGARDHVPHPAAAGVSVSVRIRSFGLIMVSCVACW